MTIRQQTIKVLSQKYGVDLKTATDEEMVTFMKYYKLNGTAELYKQLRSYEHNN